MIAALTALAARLPWLRIAKIAAPVLAILALAAALWWAHSVIERTRVERDVAVADVLEFRRAVTDATVAPTAAGDRPLLSIPDAKAALAAVVRDRDDARVNLGRIDRETKAARQRADQADAQLVRQQAANVQRLGAAQSRIDALEQARPSPIAAENDAAIDDDSKAAWESWR